VEEEVREEGGGDLPDQCQAASYAPGWVMLGSQHMWPFTLQSSRAVVPFSSVLFVQCEEALMVCKRPSVMKGLTLRRLASA